MIFPWRRLLPVVLSCVAYSVASPAFLSAQATAAAPVQPVVPNREIVSEFVKRNPAWSCPEKVGVLYTATVRVNIDVAGKPSGAQIEQSAGRACLDDLAIASVNAAAFTAARGKDGKPMASTIVVPVNYLLQKSASPEQVAAQPDPASIPELSTGGCPNSASGNVIISLTVTVDGRPANIKLDRSSGNTCLDKRVLKAAEQYRFKPAANYGHATATRVIINVNFRVF